MITPSMMVTFTAMACTSVAAIGPSGRSSDMLLLWQPLSKSPATGRPRDASQRKYRGDPFAGPPVPEWGL